MFTMLSVSGCSHSSCRQTEEFLNVMPFEQLSTKRKRIMGYCAERMMSVWLLKQNLRLKNFPIMVITKVETQKCFHSKYFISCMRDSPLIVMLFFLHDQEILLQIQRNRCVYKIQLKQEHFHTQDKLFVHQKSFVLL